MSTQITGENIGDAWLAGFNALVAGHAEGVVNLTVTVKDPLVEDIGVRRAIERCIVRQHNLGLKDFAKPQSMHTVANTIFPVSLYRRGRPEQFFRSTVKGQEGRGGKATSWGRSGTYIGRMVRYPTAVGHIENQLETILQRLNEKGRNYKDFYEIGLEKGSDTLDDDGHGVCSNIHAGAAIYMPGVDRSFRGGQCLSHVSLTLVGGKLSLTALYRHQVYVSKAYGNFVGLARLLAFLANESGNEVGEMMIVATHADTGLTKKESAALRDDAIDNAGDLQEVELVARKLGASWRDLDLPSSNR